MVGRLAVFVNLSNKVDPETAPILFFTTSGLSLILSLVVILLHVKSLVLYFLEQLRDNLFEIASCNVSGFGHGFS
jgi:hypothetical protein